MSTSSNGTSDKQGLDIIVAGAGIAGLCAAIALRQAGHNVEIFEKSKFASEIGAALGLSPNGMIVLRSFGFDFRRSKSRPQDTWEIVNAKTLQRVHTVYQKDMAEKFGEVLRTLHRVDLHQELLRLALDQEGPGRPVVLHLNSRIVKANPELGQISLGDGSVHMADLVVAADGSRSVLRREALKTEDLATSSGLSAFRFLANTETLRKDEAMRELMDEFRGVTTMANGPEMARKHIVWYDCRDGEVQNFVGIHPSRDSEDGAPENHKEQMTQEFSDYNPLISKIIQASEEVSCWPLEHHAPLPQWTYGRTVLIGDAAHPMLPFGGQGANQAIEDAGALGVVLKGVNKTSDVSKRLKIFESVRRLRATRSQIMSKVPVNFESQVAEEVKQYTGGEDIRIPTNVGERMAHDLGFNVLEKCEQALAQA